MIHDVGDTGPYFDPTPPASRPVSVRTLSFLPSTSLGLELFAQYTPSPPPTFRHFRVFVGANAASNSSIILLLALQILSL